MLMLSDDDDDDDDDDTPGSVIRQPGKANVRQSRAALNEKRRARPYNQARSANQTHSARRWPE
jgi:hypothetical protein